MAHTSVTNGRKATSPARIRLLDIISARRSIRSATTPANGPSVNHGTDRRPRATPTAAGLPVSWFTYTASAMNVTNDPASEIQSESQNALSSGVLKIPNSDAARRSPRTGIAGIMGRAARAGRSGHALALTRPGGGGQSARHAHTTSNPTWPPTHGGRPGGRGGAGRRLHREHRPGHRRQDPHRGLGQGGGHGWHRGLVRRPVGAGPVRGRGDRARVLAGGRSVLDHRPRRRGEREERSDPSGGHHHRLTAGYLERGGVHHRGPGRRRGHRDSDLRRPGLERGPHRRPRHVLGERLKCRARRGLVRAGQAMERGLGVRGPVQSGERPWELRAASGVPRYAVAFSSTGGASSSFTGDTFRRCQKPRSARRAITPPRANAATLASFAISPTFQNAYALSSRPRRVSPRNSVSLAAMSSWLSGSANSSLETSA